MQIIVADGLINFCKVFEGFKRVILVLSTKESPNLSALNQELLDKNLAVKWYKTYKQSIKKQLFS